MRSQLGAARRVLETLNLVVIQLEESPSRIFTRAQRFRGRIVHSVLSMTARTGKTGRKKNRNNYAIP